MYIAGLTIKNRIESGRILKKNINVGSIQIINIKNCPLRYFHIK